MIAATFERQRDQALRFARNAMSYSLILAIPMAVAGTILAVPLVQWIYRSAFSGAGPLLAVLVWWLPFSFTNNVLGHVLGAMGQQTRVLKVTVINAGVNIALNLILIPRYGAMGAAWTTVATEILGLILIRGVVLSTLGPVFDFRRIGGIALASTSLLILLPFTDRVHPFLLSLCSPAVFFAAAFATGALRSSDIRQIRDLFFSRRA
jgi:O-antigen/teichoic acid export membrane protein